MTISLRYFAVGVFNAIAKVTGSWDAVADVVPYAKRKYPGILVRFKEAEVAAAVRSENFISHSQGAAQRPESIWSVMPVTESGLLSLVNPEVHERKRARTCVHG